VIAENDIHERIAELLPEANRAGYYRHIARVRKLNPDDDVLAPGRSPMRGPK
jgi:hypothetical protein